MSLPQKEGNEQMDQNDVHERNRVLLERIRQGDTRAEETMLVENFGLVRQIAGRFLDRGAEYEDLVQIGTVGMLKAIRSFEPRRGTVFSTYAVPLIIGEIRRHLRDSGPVKVSRIYKRRGVSLMHEKNRIFADEGREAGIAELAERCGMSVEEAAVSLDALSPVVSLSDYVYGEDTVTVEGVLSDEESERESERICDRVAISQSINRMPPVWRQIVILRYYRNMTQQQVAALLGLTQVKISREEKKILEFLRKELA
ncbi:MAG: sigma-70 family RNA polymerase sigma factor [Ruminococcaceae bacterium]|nr:sigma-70 family RNA polymerase sigma factor [Oscillospiraceae bacterium]